MFLFFLNKNLLSLKDSLASANESFFKSNISKKNFKDPLDSFTFINRFR